MPFQNSKLKRLSYTYFVYTLHEQENVHRIFDFINRKPLLLILQFDCEKEKEKHSIKSKQSILRKCNILIPHRYTLFVSSSLHRYLCRFFADQECVLYSVKNMHPFQSNKYLMKNQTLAHGIHSLNLRFIPVLLFRWHFMCSVFLETQDTFEILKV